MLHVVQCDTVVFVVLAATAILNVPGAQAWQFSAPLFLAANPDGHLLQCTEPFACAN